MSNAIQGQTKKASSKKVSTLFGIRYSNSGIHITNTYKRVFDKERNKSPVKSVDKFNLFDFIQASRSTTDLALLQKRYLELGEIPNVDPSASGIDFATLPSNIHEVYDLVSDVDNNFAKLPKSIQDVFGNSQNYMQSLMNGTYQTTLLEYIKKNQKQAEPTEGGN